MSQEALTQRFKISPLAFKISFLDLAILGLGCFSFGPNILELELKLTTVPVNLQEKQENELPEVKSKIDASNLP